MRDISHRRTVVVTDDPSKIVTREACEEIYGEFQINKTLGHINVRG